MSLDVELAIKLNKFLSTGKTFFLKLEPEVFDFTDLDFSGKLVFSSQNSNLEVQIDKKNLIERLSLLQIAFFDNKDISIVGWNVKNLISFIRYYARTSIGFECKYLDLSVLEEHLGVFKPIPDFNEAVLRTKSLFANNSWREIYNKIYLPLIFEVIPALEVSGICNIKTREILYTYYSISQSGLMPKSVYKRSCVPDLTNSDLRPKGVDEVFIYISFLEVPQKIIFLEKLIYLYNKLKGYGKVAGVINNGYIVYANKANVKTIASLAKECMISVDLPERVSCSTKTGMNLQEMERI